MITIIVDEQLEINTVVNAAKRGVQLFHISNMETAKKINEKLSIEMGNVLTEIVEIKRK